MRFIKRAYLNRRYTRLGPSWVLAAVVGLAYLGALPIAHGKQQSPLGAVIDLFLVAVTVALYPFAREIYFRATAPLRQSAPFLILPLRLWAVVYAMKLIMFLLIVSFTIPLGIVGFAYLSVTEHRGTASYRFT